MPAQSSMPDISIPQARRIVVDTTGAQIVQEESPAVSIQLMLFTYVVNLFCRLVIPVVFIYPITLSQFRTSP